MPLVWTKTYSVGVRELDDHHRELFSLLNSNLKSVLDKNGDSKTIATDLKKLHDYAIYHFKAEEDFFLKINYPDAEVHRLEHEEFKKELLKLDVLADGTDDLARLKLLLLLSSWFTQHVMTSDKKYVPYLAAK
jgi:hemerythrin